MLKLIFAQLFENNRTTVELLDYFPQLFESTSSNF